MEARKEQDRTKEKRAKSIVTIKNQEKFVFLKKAEITV